MTSRNFALSVQISESNKSIGTTRNNFASKLSSDLLREDRKDDFASVHKKWNSTRCYTIENLGEVLLPPLELYVILDEKPSEHSGALGTVFKERTHILGTN